MDCVQGCLYAGSPSRQTIKGCVCNGLKSTEPGKLIGTKFSFQKNLWEHDGRIRVRHYAGDRCLPECVIERHSGLTPGVMPDMSPTEPLWDLVGRRLARDPRTAFSKDELWLRIQVIWNSLPQADIQNLFDTM
ncbi:transposable element Tcb2 transposase [Trichonephila clavipes]|nr:transposable element Tcb2 transposase [Trichonephila clavipes]